MDAKSIHDEVLGEIVMDYGRNVWIATTTIRRGWSIEIRLLGLGQTLKIARQLFPWIRDHEEQARNYAADHLLDLHNEVCNKGKPMSRAAFVKRLRLDSAAFFSKGCTMCYKDRLQGWEHTVVVVATKQQTFVRADTAPLLRRPESKIHVHPFPPLVLADGEWTGKVLLRSWRGFQSRLGSYGSANSARGSDGTIHLHVTAPDKNGKAPPSLAQAKAFSYLLEHEKAIRDAILPAIMAAYPVMKEKYGYSEDDTRELMPELRVSSDLKKLIGLSTVHILTTSKSKFAYLGFEFGCSWDSEHGLGVMTHKNRVVEVGDADTSFLDWIAEKDAKP